MSPRSRSPLESASRSAVLEFVQREMVKLKLEGFLDGRTDVVSLVGEGHIGEMGCLKRDSFVR